MASHIHSISSHLQVLGNAGNFQIPDPTGHVSRFGQLGCSPKRRFLLSIFTTIVSFGILGVNYVGFKGPIVIGKEISGSGRLIPHTSLTIPLSGLYCEYFILDRVIWDNSDASVSWNATVYVVPEKPPYYDQYDFIVANNDVTLDRANCWYMRYVHLHSGSEFTINSCLKEGAQNR